MNELNDEIFEVAPDWRRYTDVLRRVHTVRFKRGTYEAVFDELKLAKLGLSVEDSLELLYRFSIIGFTKIAAAAAVAALRRFSLSVTHRQLRPRGTVLQRPRRFEGDAGAGGVGGPEAERRRLSPSPSRTTGGPAPAAATCTARVARDRRRRVSARPGRPYCDLLPAAGPGRRLERLHRSRPGAAATSAGHLVLLRELLKEFGSASEFYSRHNVGAGSEHGGRDGLCRRGGWRGSAGALRRLRVRCSMGRWCAASSGRVPRQDSPHTRKLRASRTVGLVRQTASEPVGRVLLAV